MDGARHPWELQLIERKTMNKKLFTVKDLKEAFNAGYDLAEYEWYRANSYANEKIDWKPNYSIFEEWFTSYKKKEVY